MNYICWISKFFDKSHDYVFITGASSGIGYEYLRKFAAEGCNCIVLANEELIFDVAKTVSAEFKVKVMPILLDLSDIDALLATTEMLKKYKISVLINNAGFGYKGLLLDMAPELIVKMVNVNSIAPTLVANAIVPNMRAMNKGLVISVATINITTPIAKNCIYTASKFYTWAFSMAMREENSDRQIFFQTLLPGTTDTPFHIKQGAKPNALVMTAKSVADYSLENLHKPICIPNKFDRFLFPIFTRLPVLTKMKIATKMLKSRLGV